MYVAFVNILLMSWVTAPVHIVEVSIPGQDPVANLKRTIILIMVGLDFDWARTIVP